MDPRTTERLRDIEARLEEWRFPPQIVIETTAHCNFKCVHCNHKEMERPRQYRRRRRLAVAGAAGVVCAVAGVGVFLSRAPLFPWSSLTPADVVATFLLATVCSLGWIAAESAG